MEDGLKWFGFWIFAACAVLAMRFSGPNSSEIQASARREVAVELAKKGASPELLLCILNPPVFGKCKAE